MPRCTVRRCEGGVKEVCPVRFPHPGAVYLPAVDGR